MKREPTPPIGTLTDRVEIKQRMSAGEDEGGLTVGYMPLATVWARVPALSARQAVTADARGSSISHSVVMRFRTDIRVGDRLMYRGRRLEVVSYADLNGRRSYLSCQCIERALHG